MFSNTGDNISMKLSAFNSCKMYIPLKAHYIAVGNEILFTVIVKCIVVEAEGKYLNGFSE